MNDFYDRVDLSEAGERRKEEILRAAIGAGRVRRWRVRSVQVGGALAIVLVAVLLNIHLRDAAHPSNIVVKSEPVPVEPASIRPVNKTEGQVVILQIQTEPTLLQRLAVPPQKPNWRVLSDDELLRALAEAGTPAGLNYEANGQVAVLYRNQ
jgi:hypothetical protein